MLKYKLRKLSKRKLVVWTTIVLLFVVSMFSIVRYYAISSANLQDRSSGISGDTVYVNDLEADWNYYIGLNFTQITDKKNLPTYADRYNKNNLVAVQINYDGRDVNNDNWIGYVSPSEKQSKFVYYKYYPVENGQIKIELIDNPYTLRPTNKGFNGWVCDIKSTDGVGCSDLVFALPDSNYVRYLTVPAPEPDSNGEMKLIINLRASWVDANIQSIYETAKTAFDAGGTNKQIPYTTDTTSRKYKTYGDNFSFANADKSYYNVSAIKTVGFGETFSGYQIEDYSGSLEKNKSYNLTYINEYTCGSEIITEDENEENEIDYDSIVCHYLDTTEEKAKAAPNSIFLDFVNNAGTYTVTLKESVDVLKTSDVSVKYTNSNTTVFKNGDSTAGYLNTSSGWLIMADRSTTVFTYNLQADEKYINDDITTCQTNVANWKTCKVLVPKVQNGYTVYEQDDTGNYKMVYEEKEVTVNPPTNYYYKVTRDTNILRASSSSWFVVTSNMYEMKKPFTVSGVGENGTVTGAYMFIDKQSSAYIAKINADLVIENLYFTSGGINTKSEIELSATATRDTAYSLESNGYNLKIGRGMKPKNNSSHLFLRGITGNKKGKVIVESGRYSYLRSLGNISGTIENAHMISVYGSDYDRVSNNNSNLNVYYQVIASDLGNWNSNSITPSSEMTAKSGTFGTTAINQSSNGSSYYTYGIYAGTINSGNSTSIRSLKIEGGKIFSVNGGPCVSSNINGNSISIYMTGGVVDNIVGGAGTTQTYGNRIVSVTGGIVNNAVAGGSNSYTGTSSPGPLNADTLVYIGGNATIGGTISTTDRNNTLYGVTTKGSVFGAGLGRSGSTTYGGVNNSRVVINGGTINGDVYGGGNYGGVGVANSHYGTFSTIDLYNVNIKGNVFGGANANGFGTDNNKTSSNVTVNMYGGTVNNIFGGSNTSGTIFGTTNINLYGGTVNNAYGGGYGSATRVYGNTNVKTSTSNDSLLNIKNVYGGSSQGRVNASTNSTSYNSSYSTNVTINGGTVSEAVYGGSEGTTSIAPYSLGQINVIVNSGDINNVFGGNNVNGKLTTHTGTRLKVTINGGTINNVYGGSNGSNAGANTTNVVVNGGVIKTAVYGGGKQAPTSGTANVTINGGTFFELGDDGYVIETPAAIYGGGERATVNTTKVNIENGANVYDVYGGSNYSGVVTTSNVNNNAGNIFCNSYGGGNIATVTTSNNNLNGSSFNYTLRDGETIYNATCGNAFGGGKSANVGTANVKLNGSSLINIYGGSNQDGVVSKVKIEANKGTSKTIFGGNNAGGSTANSYISYNQNGGTLNVDNIFGGSNGRGATTTNSTYIQMLNGTVKEDIFGGGNEARVLGTTIVNMYGGSVRNIYGGGNSSFVGDANESSGAFVSGTKEGSTRVNVVNGNVIKNVYGSGNSSFVYGTTHVNIGNKAIEDIKSIGSLPIGTVYNPDSVGKNIVINGSVFGGSETNADESTKFDYSYNGVIGDATIYVDGTSYGKNLRIDGSLFGSGNNSATSGITKLYINKYGLANSPNTSTSIQRFMNVYITDSYIELNGDKDRANGKPYKYSLVRLDNLYVLGSKSTNNTLNGSELYLVSGSTYLKSIYSGTMNGTYSEDNFVAQTTINSGNSLINGNSNNKIYMYTNKILSISNSEEPSYDAQSTPAGSVHGMSFLGMYTHQVGGPYVKGIYDTNLQNGSVVSDSVYSEITNSSYTFVYGKHDYDSEQQIKTNGYYTNYVDDETRKLTVDYVGVSPLNALYYKWTIGDEPTDIVVNLQATRYSVDGAVNKTIDLDELREEIIAGNPQEWHDATMRIYEVDTSGFGARAPDVKESYDTYLVDRTQIPFFNLDDENGDNIIDSNQKFALSMGTTTAGWMGKYKTNFYDRDKGENFGEDFCEIGSDGDCVGDSMYIYDSTTVQRSLSFWLYHSKNLDFNVAGAHSEDEDIEIPLGTVYIRSEFTNVHGDPTDASTTRPVRIVVNISMYEGSDDAYGKSISPGKKYEVFSNRPTAIASDGSFSIYQSLSLDLNADVLGTNNGEKWDVNKVYNKAYTTTDKDNQLVEVSEAYRYLRSSYVLPVGTRITMLDMTDGEQYYYIVDEEKYNKILAESLINKGDARYKLEEFIRMGCTDVNNKYDDDMNGEDSTKYRHLKENYDGTISDLAIEEFIFTVDFSGVSEENRTKTELRPYLYMLLSRDENGVEKKILGPTGIPDTEMSYTIHPYVDTTIKTDGGYIQEDGTLTSDTVIYFGHTADLKLNTNLVQTDRDGNILNSVADTVYDDYKLGARIKVLIAKTNEKGETVYEQVSQSLFGTVFSINGKHYYPQTDGITTLELAGKVTDVISELNVDFTNSSLSTQKYKLVVETFASYDGLYFGNAVVTYNEFPFELLNDQYGLNVSVPSSQIVHDVNTGQDIDGNTEIIYTIDAKNGLAKPNLKISLQRREYDGIYTNSYVYKDLKDIVEEVYMEGKNSALITCYSSDENGNCIYYTLGEISSKLDGDVYTVKVKLKDGPSYDDIEDKVNAKWKSGTYRMVFTMFDDNTAVGEVYEYLIIRSLGIDEEVEGS